MNIQSQCYWNLFTISIAKYNKKNRYLFLTMNRQYHEMNRNISGTNLRLSPTAQFTTSLYAIHSYISHQTLLTNTEWLLNLLRNVFCGS